MEEYRRTNSPREEYWDPEEEYYNQRHRIPYRRETAEMRSGTNSPRGEYWNPEEEYHSQRASQHYRMPYSRDTAEMCSGTNSQCDESWDEGKEYYNEQRMAHNGPPYSRDTAEFDYKQRYRMPRSRDAAEMNSRSFMPRERYSNHDDEYCHEQRKVNYDPSTMGDTGKGILY
uniref:Uncharacterized protein n=1 Tax=Ditylum brightwellii TaxID=49249 RepID=A0A7S4V1B5_9STRA